MQFGDKQRFPRTQRTKAIKTDKLDLIKMEDLSKPKKKIKKLTECLKKDCYPRKDFYEALLQLNEKEVKIWSSTSPRKMYKCVRTQ